MMYRMEILVSVDNEKLDEWDGQQNPPPNDVTDWDVSDLFIALKMGIVDRSESTIVSCHEE